MEPADIFLGGIYGGCTVIFQVQWMFNFHKK
jgi:uncharacterized glyoxalase superfamily protein PhnB